MGGQGVRREPVTDWATDFDHLSAEWAAGINEICADLRERCPVAHTDRFYGAYLITRYDDAVAVAHDTARYSNRITAVNENKPESIRLEAPPITLDPPFHGPVRRALLAPFAPKAVERLVPMVSGVCDRALDALSGREQVDAALDYAQIVPLEVTANLLGLPEIDGDRFRGWVKAILSDGLVDLPLAARATREVRAYFAEQLADRRARGVGPEADLVAWVGAARVVDDDGVSRPFTEREQLGALYLLLVAGIDTTWSAIGAALHELSVNPVARRRLADEPALWDSAVEEFLRLSSPINMARMIDHDGVVGGCPLQAGQRLLLSFASANRDASQFDRPEELVLDRTHNRHLAFGVGVHRCLGSNLARMELRVALQRWLARYPDFEPAGPVRWTIGVRGPATVPLRVGVSAVG